MRDKAFVKEIEEILTGEMDHIDEVRRWLRAKASGIVEDRPVDQMDDQQAQDAAEPLQEPALPDVAPGEYSVVGDARRLTAYSLSPDGFDSTAIGEAWQDDAGALHGTGIFYVMLFETFSKKMYREASIGLDASPLTLLAMRLTRSPFVKVEWKEGV